MLAAGERKERLAAKDLFWAVEAVNEAMEGDDPLVVLDALAEAPDADLCYLGAGPVEDLLTANPVAWAATLAGRCRTSERWRKVLACVWLDDADREQVEPLAPYLKPYG